MAFIKIKILNHMLLDGKKKTSEKILLQGFKELQKFSTKQSGLLIPWAIFYSMPIFKIHKQIKKNRKKKYTKEIPTIITARKARISLAIKFILRDLKNNNLSRFYTKFYTEVLSTAQNEGSVIQKKNDMQKQVWLKKHFFFNYRWR